MQKNSCDSSIVTKTLVRARAFNDLIPLLQTLDLDDALLEEISSYKSADRYLYVLQLVPGSGVDRVLDVGIGQGHLAILVRLLFGLDVSGVDINAEYLPRFGSWGINCEKVDIETEKLPFEDGSIDLVLFCEVLEHLENPSSVLNEIGRVLGQTGCLVLTTPKLRMPRYLTESAFIVIKDILRMYPPEYFEKRRQGKGVPHVKEYTLSGIKRLLLKNGFSVKGFWLRRCLIPPTGIPQGAKSWQACLHRLRLLARKVLFGSRHVDIIICAVRRAQPISV